MPDCLPPLPLVRMQRDIAFSSDYVSVARFKARRSLVAAEALAVLAREAFRVVAFHYRSSHLAKVAAILGDPEATKNDRLVALTLLENAVVASEGRLPMCQDTGTSIIFAKKGRDARTTSVTKSGWRGIFRRTEKENLRYSHKCSTLDVSRCQLEDQPAGPDRYFGHRRRDVRASFRRQRKGVGEQVDAVPGDARALVPAKLEAFLDEKLRSIGTAACPPYHLRLWSEARRPRRR